MSPEKAVPPSNSIVMDGPEVVRDAEPSLIEQLDFKTAEYLDLSKRIEVYTALESEFVQEFIEVAGAEVVAEALSLLYTDHFLAEPVGFTGFMRKVLKVSGDTSRTAADQLSKDVTLSFYLAQNLFCGDNPPSETDSGLLATTQRQYAPGKLESLEKNLAAAAPRLGRPEWLVALARVASEMAAPELDEDDIEVNGFERARYDFDRDAFETDLGENDCHLIKSRLLCAKRLMYTEAEIGDLVAQEHERINSELDIARQSCVDNVKSGLGEDFLVEWNPVTDGLKVERLTMVDPTDFRDGVSHTDVDTVIMPAMLEYSRAMARWASGRVTLRTHDVLSMSRLMESKLHQPTG